MTTPTRDRLLQDRHSRRFSYLRIAVTERCNLRCVYCMPEEGIDFARGERLLSGDEITRIVRVTAQLGITKLRLTGGEPLIRRDLLTIIRDAMAVPAIESVHLTTNGLLLEPKLEALQDAGLTGVNISLDTLREDRFEAISRRPGLQTVLSAIHASAARLPSVKVNVVALRGFNDDEIVDFARLTTTLPITVRFIEFMPFDAQQIWKTGRYKGSERIISALDHGFPNLERTTGSATERHVFRLPDAPGRIAVIPAFSRTLCSACNRVRLTADGRIMNCLYAADGLDLRPLLRGDAGDLELADAFSKAMWQKPVDGFAAQKSAGVRRGSMSRIGG